MQSGVEQNCNIGVEWSGLEWSWAGLHCNPRAVNTGAALPELPHSPVLSQQCCFHGIKFLSSAYLKLGNPVDIKLALMTFGWHHFDTALYLLLYTPYCLNSILFHLFSLSSWPVGSWFCHTTEKKQKTVLFNMFQTGEWHNKIFFFLSVWLLWGRWVIYRWVRVGPEKQGRKALKYPKAIRW